MVKEGIKKDFEFIKNKVLAVLLYGSYAIGKETPRSDIDICLVTPKIKDKNKLLKEVWQQIGGKYDARIFEELPLHIKIGIIKNHKIIFTQNKLDLYEYFYFYRKLWNDQKNRQTMTKKEMLAMI